MSDDPLTNRRLRDALPAFEVASSLVIGVTLTAVLYFGRSVLVPIALGILLSFVLAPLVRRLQRLRLPRSLAVLVAIALATLGFVVLGGIVGRQLAEFAGELPQFRGNIHAKILSLRGATEASGAFGRAIDELQDLGREMQAPLTAGDRSGADKAPLPVDVVSPSAGPLGRLSTLLAPMLEPLSTVGIVLIFAVFMLIQREDLRNRFIRLAGKDDLQRTTAALDDAGRRLSRYFLTQLGLNAAFGAAIGVGLGLLGVPHPVLWGILGAVLRFVPYVGSAIAAALPVIVSAAVDPGWSVPISAALLVVGVELVMGQVIEPLLYGHSTGLSPLAIIVAATFWTFLWGPIGLVLSTPLTVALVVIGRYVERLRFLDIVLGDRPVLLPKQMLYQRMLAGDPGEAVEQAKGFLKERALATYYDEVVLGAMLLAQDDIAHGLLTNAQQAVLASSIKRLVEALANVKDRGGRRHGPLDAETAAAVEVIGPDRAVARLARPIESVHPDWRGSVPVLCVAGQGPLDAAIANMLAQCFIRQGLNARVIGLDAVASEAALPFDTAGTALVCFSYLEALSTVHVRYAARRLRRKLVGRSKVMVGLWQQRDPATVDSLRRAVSADRLVTSLHEALDVAAGMALEPTTAASDTRSAVLATA